MSTLDSDTFTNVGGNNPTFNNIDVLNTATLEVLNISGNLSEKTSTNIKVLAVDDSNNIVGYTVSGGGDFADFASSIYTECARPINIINPLPSATSNIDICINTRGAGSLIRNIPDQLPGGGNCRGINSVDLQTSRSHQIMVASGAFSIISGGRNNRATASDSVISGGRDNRATGTDSNVAGGRLNQANGSHSCVLGGLSNECNNQLTTVCGGNANIASGNSATVCGGDRNIASQDYSFACGKFNLDGNLAGAPRRFMVGDGNTNAARNNLFSITTLNLGTCYANGGIVSGSADFAEYFESDGPKYPVGTVVMFNDGYITKSTDATKSFGVISNTHCILGNSQETNWVGKYERDAENNLIYENYTVEDRIERKPKISKVYDPELKYIPRSERDEWNIVGLLGVVFIKPGELVHKNWININANKWLIR